MTEQLIKQLSKSLTIVGSESQTSDNKFGVTSPLVNYPDNSNTSYADENPLYVITPTYRRPEQVPELTRMAHTLMLVRNVHWLVIEDAQNATEQVTELLRRTGLKYEHLVGEFSYLGYMDIVYAYSQLRNDSSFLTLFQNAK